MIKQETFTSIQYIGPSWSYEYIILLYFCVFSDRITTNKRSNVILYNHIRTIRNLSDISPKQLKTNVVKTQKYTVTL